VISADTPVQSEPDAYSLYQQDPSPANLKQVVFSVQPTIDYTLRNLGAQNDPVMRATARTIAADAVKSFDPSRGALSTHVSSQLRRLYREGRKRRSPIPVPERMQLDQLHVQRVYDDFLDTHGKEPTMEEWADKARIPLPRLQKVLQANRPIGTESGATEQGVDSPEVTSTDWNREALEYVYADSDRIDKKLLEFKTGIYGAQKISNAEIGKRLNLAPYQISRRSLRLSKKISEIVRDLEG
jgi:DNA-directed RNA polymerase specialized sigma subunit